MARNSRIRKNYISDLSEYSNSSDSGADDLTVVPRSSKGKNLSSFNGRKRKPGLPRKERKFEQDYASCSSSSTTRRIRIPLREEGDKGKKKFKATILSWLIDLKTVRENVDVYYNSRTNEVKEGILQRGGILCTCCKEVFTVENFQVHAGERIDKPYKNIFVTETCVSLFSYMAEAWKKPVESKNHQFNHIVNRGCAGDIHDDACIICADGGNLMCCDQCTSTYHITCINMKEIPQHNWYSPYCACKFCRQPAQGNDYLLTCSTCEKKYHWDCYKNNEPITIDLNCTPSASFCESSCKEVQDKLEKIVGVKKELHDGYSWTLLQRREEGFTTCGTNDLYKTIECHSKVAVACRMMKESFEPITDRHTKVDVIRSVVYNCGSNFNRVNFGSFYVAILEKGDELISVASIRIHGTKLAEMPFIATSQIHRRKGMCAKLMNEIVSALSHLNTEKLVIPSSPETTRTWIEKYGFCAIEDKVKEEIMVLNTLMFHDSERLQKIIRPFHSGDAVEEAEIDNRPRTHALPDLNLEPQYQD